MVDPSPKPCGAACNLEESPHFLIHTPACVIPDFDPAHPSIAKFRINKPDKIVCSTKRPLTEAEGLFLHLYKDRIKDYNTSWEDLKCTYQGIRRIQQDPEKYNRNCDKVSKLTPSVSINQELTVIDEDGILVTCTDTTQNKSIVYKDIHYFIQPRRVQGKREKFKKEIEQQQRPHRNKLNVVIMGTDAVSRGNLIRHMPKTLHYLKHELGAIDFRGFTKVGDNTEPNMLAALMGLSYDEFMKHKCHPKRWAKFDDCPLIWREFSKQGYATAYAEDAAWMGLFHFNKLGYVKEPTDYYNRPYYLMSEKHIGHNGGRRGYNAQLCQGNRRSMDVIHDYSLTVADALKDMPYFGYFWTCSITHDYLKVVSAADLPSLRYLKEFKRRGHQENTVLFFISDHGLRWGSFRSTYAGMLEERLPFVMLVFPPWFKEEYPEAWANMATNTRRLTSTFDLHVTMMDIMYQRYADLSAQPTPFLHGQSLFRVVPLNRTCEDASVPEHFCACQHSTEVDAEDPRLKPVAQFVVKKINEGLQAFPKCAPLKLKKIMGGRIGTATNSTKPKKENTVALTYTLTLVTKPGEAQLESTVRYHDKTYELVADVSRINKYGNQSHCITDFIYRKYCYCKDLL